MSARIIWAALWALVVLLGGCTPGGGAAATNAPTSVATDVRDGETTSTSGGSTGSTDPGSVLELSEVASLGAVALGEPGPGPHPALVWEPFDGASSYWLVVFDAAGDPYWAWTGSDPSVRVGGGSVDGMNQTAVVHETMTWRVAAFDANGTLIALSREGTISR